MCRNVFSLCVSDSRFAAVPISPTWMDRQQGIRHIHNNTHSHPLYTSWNILAPLVSSAREFWLQHHLLLDCFMALCNQEQKTAVTIETSCSATSVFKSYSMKKCEYK